MARQTRNATENTTYSLGIPWMTLPIFLSNATLTEARAWAVSELFSRYVETKRKNTFMDRISIAKVKDGKVVKHIGMISDFDHESMSALWTDYKTGESYCINLAGVKIAKLKRD